LFTGLTINDRRGGDLRLRELNELIAFFIREKTL
jgi:hypothetical protein